MNGDTDDTIRGEVIGEVDLSIKDLLFAEDFGAQELTIGIEGEPCNGEIVVKACASQEFDSTIDVEAASVSDD